MIDILILVISCLLVFAAFILTWYLIRIVRIKEKSMLIEKGIDIKDLNLIVDKKSQFSWLKIGIVITGTALGSLFCRLVIAKLIHPGGPTIDISVIVLFAGLSMILANFVGDSKSQK